MANEHVVRTAVAPRAAGGSTPPGPMRPRGEVALRLIALVLAGGLLVLAGRAWGTRVVVDAGIAQRLDSIDGELANLSNQLSASAASTTTVGDFDLPIPNHDAQVVTVVGVVEQLLRPDGGDGWSALVDDPTGLDATIDQLRHNRCSAGAGVHVIDARIVGPDQARVAYQVEGPNVPAVIPQTADVVLVDGHWKVTRTTVMALYTLAKPSCGLQ